MELNTILEGDVLTRLQELPDGSVDCIITSPPYYGLRDYGMSSQIGLELTLDEYLEKMLTVTAELHRILKKEGTLWWNHGDSYSGSSKGKGDKQNDPKWPGGSRSRDLPMTPGTPKCLSLQPYRLLLSMIDRQGWVLRNQIVWHKLNVMPFPVTDRFTVDFEPVFFLTKSQRYYFEQQFEPLKQTSIERVKYGWKSTKANASVKGRSEGIAIEEMGSRFANPRGRNKRTVWSMSTSSSRTNHAAPFPEKLIETMIAAGCPQGGVVLDPFMGSGTTAVVAKKLGRHYLGIELNPDYIKISEERLSAIPTSLFDTPHHG